MDYLMIDTIYYEEDIFDHPTAMHVRKALPSADWFPIRNYQELFNKRHQNFRLQKKQPKLILARKHGNFVLPVPSGFGMDAKKNFYFSHMYNCLYDCKYCFLQGLYSSANFVLFVNYEDFFQAISDSIERCKGNAITFFSGYDCDSLAFDKISGFASQALNFFSHHPEVELELRTKSIAVNSLFAREAIPNCIVAFSLSPSKISDALDHRSPSLVRRVNTLKKLAKCGWKIGLRFDPLIYCEEWEELYSELIEDIMQDLDDTNIHSVSYGPLRFPKKMYKKIVNLRPHEKLYAFPMVEKNSVISYGSNIETRMHSFLELKLRKFVPKNKVFQCVV